MRKRLIILICILASVFCLTPINANAKSYKTLNDHMLNININNYVYSLILDGVREKQDKCPPTKAVLGDVGCEESVAWLLQKIFNYVKIIGPILVVILSSFDFITVIVKSDDEAMGKATKKLTTRLILAALLFFIPTLVQVLLDLFGLTSNLGGIQ